MRRKPGNRKAVAGLIIRHRSGAYNYIPPERLKVCPNPDCPRPSRTYAKARRCPFCGTPLRYEEGHP